MRTAKMLISLPSELSSKFQTLIPRRQRSQVLCRLIEEEIVKREKALYDCALAVEKDDALNKELQDWSSTLNDGINNNESW